MEHSNPKLVAHCTKVKELVEAGEFGAVNQKDFGKLLAKTPYKNKAWAGDAVLETLFEVAKSKMSDDGDKEILDKLLGLVKIHEKEVKVPAPLYQEALFFPSETNVDKLCNYLKMAKTKLRICVFTITNNEIRNAILDAKDNGVNVQIITDDECMKQLGSDIEFLASKGIEVRTDSSAKVSSLKHILSLTILFILGSYAQ